MDELNTEETEAAQKYGLDIHTYRDMAAGIAAGATQKAAALGLSVEEYEAHAWDVVMEATRRGLTTEDRVEGVTEEELEEGVKQIEEYRMSGGPWAKPDEPAPWEEGADSTSPQDAT